MDSNEILKRAEKYIAEEKAQELKRLSEVAVQKYFMKSKEAKEEQEFIEKQEKILKIRQEMEK